MRTWQRLTIEDFEKIFPDDDACLRYLFERRFGKDYVCPKCSNSKFVPTLERKAYHCTRCSYQVYPMANTAFHDTTTPLTIWFAIMRKLIISPVGLSGYSLKEDYPITYKTGWRMLNIMRMAMRQDDIILSGDIEIDATPVGGRRRKDKPVIFGMIERGGGRMVAYKVPVESQAQIVPLVLKHIKKGSHIFTDDGGAYKTLTKHGYKHSTINHSKKVYGIGRKHTCTIDSSWGRFKNALKVVNKSVSDSNLMKYYDVFSFRNNHRNNSKEETFRRLLDIMLRIDNPNLLQNEVFDHLEDC